jgi:hypothetical protein
MFVWYIGLFPNLDLMTRLKDICARCVRVLDFFLYRLSYNLRMTIAPQPNRLRSVSHSLPRIFTSNVAVLTQHAKVAHTFLQVDPLLAEGEAADIAESLKRKSSGLNSVEESEDAEEDQEARDACTTKKATKKRRKTV